MATTLSTRHERSTCDHCGREDRTVLVIERLAKAGQMRFSEWCQACVGKSPGVVVPVFNMPEGDGTTIRGR